MALTDQFTRALTRLGIPVVSVSFVTETDRASWRIQYQPHATAQHRIDGDALRFTFDTANDTAGSDEDAETAVEGNKALRALTKATHELKTTAWTLQQFRDRIKAIFRSL
jgi:hypothetical protein